MADKFYYLKVREAEVPLSKRLRAKGVLEYCARILKLPGVRIQWFKSVTKEAYETGELFDRYRQKSAELLRAVVGKADDPEPLYFSDGQDAGGIYYRVFGRYEKYKDTIFLNADSPESKIGYFVAHECRHMFDVLTSAIDTGPSYFWRLEQSADRFAKEISRVLDKN
jgi:hypothetical protein